MSHWPNGPFDPGNPDAAERRRVAWGPARGLRYDPATMPVYEYRCRDCGHEFEIQQSMSDDTLTVCPSCSGDLRKVFSPVGIAFKGSGFYKNDSGSRSGSSKGDGSKGDGSKGDGSKSDGSKSDGSKSGSSGSGSDSGSSSSTSSSKGGGSGSSAPATSGSTSP